MELALCQPSKGEESMLRNDLVLLFLALVLAPLSSSPLVAQTIHREAFFTDITTQLPLEVLKQGKIFNMTSNGQEIVFLAKVEDSAAFYRQTAEGNFASLVKEGDSRIKGRILYNPLPNLPSLIYFKAFEHTYFGLGFQTYTSMKDNPVAFSAYYIKSGSTVIEPIAVVGETVVASDKEEVFSATINSAGKPSVSRDGKRKFVFLSASQLPNRSRSGIYAVENGKYKLLVRSDFPTDFTTHDSFGIREDKKGRLWFVEIHYDGMASFYLTVFDPVTGNKTNVYKRGDPIWNEKIKSVSYEFNGVTQEMYALIEEAAQIKVSSLNLSNYPGEVFQPLFSIPLQSQGASPIFTYGLVGINDIGTAVFKLIENNWNEIATSIWDGERLRTILREKDTLPDGKQINKLSFEFGYNIYGPATTSGCVGGTTFTFNDNGTIQYWLRFLIPCIQQSPLSVKSGEEITLKGQNLLAGAPLVDVVMTDDLDRETIITPGRVSQTELTFLAPLVSEVKTTRIKVRQNHLAGVVTSNVVSIKIGPSMISSPEILGITNGASFDLGQPLTPGAIFSLFGKNLGTTESARAWPLPRKLGGAKVTICGIDAPLFANTGATTRLEGGQLWQINGVVPNLASSPSCEVVVSVDQKSPSAALTARAQVKISSKSEETLALFTFTGYQPNGAQTQYPIITNQSGQLISPPGVSIPGADPAIFAQAKACEVVTLWATGGGRTFPPVADGEPAPGTPLATMLSNPAVQIYGSDADVLFSGLTPGFAGLYQVNVRVPCEAASGEQWLWFGRPDSTLGKVYKIWIQ